MLEPSRSPVPFDTNPACHQNSGNKITKFFKTMKSCSFQHAFSSDIPPFLQSHYRLASLFLNKHLLTNSCAPQGVGELLQSVFQVGHSWPSQMISWQRLNMRVKNTINLLIYKRNDASCQLGSRLQISISSYKMLFHPNLFLVIKCSLPCMQSFK